MSLTTADTYGRSTERALETAMNNTDMIEMIEETIAEMKKRCFTLCAATAMQLNPHGVTQGAVYKVFRDTEAQLDTLLRTLIGDKHRKV